MKNISKAYSTYFCIFNDFVILKVYFLILINVNAYLKINDNTI